MALSELFFPRRVALVIGNAEYREDQARLDNPDSDARTMTQALKRSGFKVYHHVNTTMAQLKSISATFAEVAKGAETIVFYYSGHGMQLSGQNYLVPIDAGNVAEKLEENCFALTPYIRQLSGITDTCLVFLDACRDNPFKVETNDKNPRRQKSKKFLIGEAYDDAKATARGAGLAEFDLPPAEGNTFISFATAPGEVASDGNGDNSPFTSALARQIGIPRLSIEELMRRVVRDVREATGGGQNPWSNANLDKTFVFKKFKWLPILLAPLFGIAAGALPALLSTALSFEFFNDDGSAKFTDYIAAGLFGVSFGFFTALFSWLFGQRQSFVAIMVLCAVSFGGALWSDAFVRSWAERTDIEGLAANELQRFVEGSVTDYSRFKYRVDIESNALPLSMIDDSLMLAEPPHQVERMIGIATGKIYEEAMVEIRKQENWQQSARVSYRLLNGGGFLVFLTAFIYYLVSHVVPALQRTSVLAFAIPGAIVISLLAPDILQDGSNANAGHYFQSADGFITSGLFCTLLVGYALSTHRAETVSPSLMLFHRVGELSKFVAPLVLALGSGILGALSYPDEALLANVLPQFFDVQMLPAIAFGTTLSFVIYRFLGENTYLSVLVFLTTLLAWFVMLPIAESVISAVLGSIIGATGFAIIVLSSLTFTNGKLQWPAFWTIGVLAAFLLALPYGFIRESEWFKGLTGNDVSELFLESASLFVLWEFVWIAIVVYFCQRPAANGATTGFVR